eukprot:903054-Pleurochrysis_carterae.AAC.1
MLPHACTNISVERLHESKTRPIIDHSCARACACMRVCAGVVDRQWMNVRARAQCAACLLRDRVGGKDKLAIRAVACATQRQGGNGEDGRGCRTGLVKT